MHDKWGNKNSGQTRPLVHVGSSHNYCPSSADSAERGINQQLAHRNNKELNCAVQVWSCAYISSASSDSIIATSLAREISAQDHSEQFMGE